MKVFRNVPELRILRLTFHFYSSFSEFFSITTKTKYEYQIIWIHDQALGSMGPDQALQFPKAIITL